MSEIKFVFLRETSEKAKRAGIDPATNLHRTGLDEYLAVIFPKTNDWIHDKALGEINGIKYKMRPDYRSESLKLIVEFDGLQHYNNPDVVEKDLKNTELYKKHGYTVVRIPYFIQLTNKAVKTLFGVDVDVALFDESIPSLSPLGRNTPAYLCPAGVIRMKEEFKKFPEQYKVNLDALARFNDPFKTGIEFIL
ncbi:DUF559 domain-containing protein [Flavobacterium davisii]|uniref:DUF559 domain-containing protein n=1 Tax=Flavobacterium davisii TaxID=2906077 RepID=UPI0035CF9416